MVQPTTKIKLTKLFDSVNLWYEINVCNVHTKTAILNALLLHDSVHYFKLKGGLSDPEGSLSTCLPTQVITLANNVVEKAVIDKGLGKKHSQYFKFMVASDAVNTFVLFDATSSLELIE